VPRIFSSHERYVCALLSYSHRYYRLDIHHRHLPQRVHQPLHGASFRTGQVAELCHIRFQTTP
jgi:hypothetical protein